jgi:3-deoxy-D-manno-octulosonic-acid transferase
VNKILYNISLGLFGFALRVAAIFNQKARLGVKGRARTFDELRPPPAQAGQPVIWMHCASLGEFEQGRPLLEWIKNEHSSAILYLSFFSASGFEVMKNYQGANQVFYLPMDRPAHARRLLAALRPSLVLWVKYEFWYYYFTGDEEPGYPLVISFGEFQARPTFLSMVWRHVENDAILLQLHFCAE